MTERERLMDLIIQAVLPLVGEPIQGPKQLEMIADFLLENGVIVPPCKVGDKLYFLYGTNTSEPWVCDFTESVCKIGVAVRNFLNGYSVYAPDDFGKTVFLTREEAEAELEKRRKEEKRE